MYCIREDTIAAAHYRVIHFLNALPEMDITEDNEFVKQYPEPISIHINYPQVNPQIVPGSLFGPQFQNEYVRKVLKITPLRNDGTDPTYTYGNRLRAYPQSGFWEKIKKWFGFTSGLDQLCQVIQRLEDSPNTRRAVMCLWDPEIDSQSNEPPCMNLIQVCIHNDSVNLVCFFRSNDMLSAYGMNTYAIAQLQKHLADELDYECGWIETISNNPHMYPTRDAYELKHILKANVKV
jgi:thymidylate synthase